MSYGSVSFHLQGLAPCTTPHFAAHLSFITHNMRQKLFYFLSSFVNKHTLTFYLSEGFIPSQDLSFLSWFKIEDSSEGIRGAFLRSDPLLYA